MHTDQNFPIITYKNDENDFQHGIYHGESFRDGIQELAAIRRNLLLEKNPSIEEHLHDLSMQQWTITSQYAPDITDEMKGICEGANITIDDIVILNNYTDFRDINLPDEGCSTVHVITPDESISGQTWDMHSSAKKYVCLIDIPGEENLPGQLYFSLVGCVGMMGIKTNNLLVGVNNLNTTNALASLIWPALIRKSLGNANNYDELVNAIKNAPVTSGHNYLISSLENGSMWEVSPKVVENVSNLDTTKKGHQCIFHTNHCLGESISKYENLKSLSSTTKERYDILRKSSSEIKSSNDLEKLLHGHDNYPKSICGHFTNNSQDPSATCGGGYFNFSKEDIYFWRGCPVYDKNFKSIRYKKYNNSFQKVSS